MSREKRAETPLAHVIDDLRRDPLPSVDWESIEDELMVKVGTTARHPVRRAVSSAFLKWSFAVAACVLGAGAFLVLRPSTPREGPLAVSPASPVQPPSSNPLNGNALSTGAIVAAGVNSVVVNHEGHVTWTLETGSTARVESTGDVIALSLEGGAVSARVVKSLRPETFVVRVENTRIAVHGTEFRVERGAKGVRITVSEGVLGIGPVGGPSFELPAPGAATLDLKGVRTDQHKADAAPQSRHAEPSRPAGAASPTAAVSAKDSPVASEAPSAEAPTVAAQPSSPPEGSAPLVELASKAVQKCFGAHALVRGDLHVSVMMKMALRVTNDGKVGDALFDPPLAPGVRECVDREIGALRFPESPDGFMATRKLELTY